MKVSRAILIMTILLLVWTVFTFAEQISSENISFVITESKTTIEKVENVDYTTRKVTLKDESGKLRIVKAGSDIQNLNKLKIGDEVTIEEP